MNVSLRVESDEHHHRLVEQTRPHGRPLRDHVRNALESYFSQLNGHPTAGLYQMVIAEVEEPLLETVLRHVGSNQTKAARILGISRSTLRKKLAIYNLD